MRALQRGMLSNAALFRYYFGQLRTLLFRRPEFSAPHIRIHYTSGHNIRLRLSHAPTTARRRSSVRARRQQITATASHFLNIRTRWEEAVSHYFAVLARAVATAHCYTGGERAIFHSTSAARRHLRRRRYFWLTGRTAPAARLACGRIFT